MDEAQRKAEGLDEEVTKAKKLKPGEIDPTPETKPARPDPVDMDDDGKHFISFLNLKFRFRTGNAFGSTCSSCKYSRKKSKEKGFCKLLLQLLTV